MLGSKGRSHSSRSDCSSQDSDGCSQDSGDSYRFTITEDSSDSSSETPPCRSVCERNVESASSSFKLSANSDCSNSNNKSSSTAAVCTDLGLQGCKDIFNACIITLKVCFFLGRQLFDAGIITLKVCFFLVRQLFDIMSYVSKISFSSTAFKPFPQLTERPSSHSEHKPSASRSQLPENASSQDTSCPSSQDTRCPVCLDSIESMKINKTNIMSTSCGHIFCQPCINSLLTNTKSSNCPTCRTTLKKSSVHRIYL